MWPLILFPDAMYKRQTMVGIEHVYIC